jgi:hypothetical protein
MTFLPKKNASFDRLAFYILKKNYFVAGTTGVGTVLAGSAGVAGVAAAGVAFCVVSIILDSESPNESVKLKQDNKTNAVKIIAKIQVLLSKKSVVF